MVLKQWISLEFSNFKFKDIGLQAAGQFISFLSIFTQPDSVEYVHLEYVHLCMDCDTSYSALASTTFQFWKTVKMQTSLTQIAIYYTFITYITLDLAAIEG